MRHLLVTNDFPPKIGGIQSYLWELWRRMPPDEAVVLTTPHEGAEGFDAAAGLRVERTRQRVLLPEPWLRERIVRLARDARCELVLLDPALPLGLIGPTLGLPYGLVLHGAEITLPGRLPGSRLVLREVLRRAEVVVAAGGYPLAEAERCAGRPLPHLLVPPGVDTGRFRPLDPPGRAAARARLGLPAGARIVLGLSRLVPRKGFDVLLRAAGRLRGGREDLLVVIGGVGRDRRRLEAIATRERAPVRFLGRVDDADLPDLYAAADVFAMLCRNRWGGLEQEGFGIVFLEAAACGVPQVAGRSGGSHEAVADGETGWVIDPPTDVAATTAALGALLDDDVLRSGQGAAARRRAVADFDQDRLAAHLAAGLRRWTALSAADDDDGRTIR